MDDELNAMEVLAMASLTIPDLASGFVGTVVLDISDFTDPNDLLKEIHEGQMALARNGWTRSIEDAKNMPYRKHNVECGAWFKNKADGSGTDWIRCTITTRFGLRASFWNTTHAGEHQLHLGG